MRIGFRRLRTRMVLWVCIFLFPILILLGVSLHWVTHSYEEQMNQNFSQSLIQYTADIDTALDAARRYVVSEKISLDFMHRKGEDGMTRLSGIQAVGESLTESLVMQPKVDALFLYDGEELVFVQNYNTSYVKNAEVSAALRDVLGQKGGVEAKPASDYEVLCTGSGYWFYFAFPVEGGIFGCWFSADTLLSDLRAAGLEGERAAYFTEEDGTVLGNPEVSMEEQEISVTKRALYAAPFLLTVLWDKDVVFLTLRRIEGLAVCVTVLSALLLLAYLLFLRKSLFVPLEQMVSDIDRLKSEEFGRLPRQKRMSEEFCCVYEALNSMTSEIRQLKIDVYEERILQQKTQMELYQLQVRPHFFQNALLSIRSFAGEKEYRKIEEMTLLLSRHCQYILYGNSFVLLDEELNYVQNYIRLQSLQHGRKYLCSISCPEELLDLEIPILAIQIFVENAVKYARTGKRPCEIEIEAKRTEEQGRSFLLLSVSDNGPGFPEEIRKKLDEGELLHQPGEKHGIGIDNIRQRLRLIYGDAARLHFCNREGKGACVTIRILDEVKERKEESRE